MRKFARILFAGVFVCVCALMTSPTASAQQPASGGEAAGAKSREQELLAAIERLTGLFEQQSRQLEEQRAALQEQQAKMALLERKLERMLAADGPRGATIQPAVALQPASNPTLPTNAPAAQPQTDPLAERVAKLETAVAAGQKTSESKWKNLGNFAFSGDVRLRYEPFFGGGVVTSPALESRHRARFRARFNVNARFNDEWSGGLGLTSGSDTDPISGNQSLDQFFERKPINIDRAFVQYQPAWMKTLLRNNGELTLTGGKFAYTWYRTEMTLDNDLNPEGISEVLDFKVRTSTLKRLVFVGFQLPFNEVSAGPDSFLHGGQIQSHWNLGSRVKFSTYVAFYDWNRTDPVRAAQISGALSGSTNRHAATPTQFASKFGVLDVIGRLDISTGSPRWPLMLLFDFASNTRACANLVNIAPPQPACNPRDRDAYWAEVQLGQTREPGDYSFGYMFTRIEREAVLGAFNYSDIRSPTNVASHRLSFGYQAYKNVTMNFAGLFGRQLTTSTSAAERYLKRLQMDVTYKF